MRRFLLIPVCFVALLVPVAVLAGGGEGFSGVVRTIETRRVPGGVSNIHVAEFEEFSGPFDGQELNDLVESKLGPGWERIIRETSHQGESQTLIFMHPEGSRMGLFVLDADGRDLNVVQVSVDPGHLSESVNHYDHHHRSPVDADASLPD